MFTILREEFLKAIKTVMEAINKKAYEPVYQDITVTKNEIGFLELLATSGDLTIIYLVEDYNFETEFNAFRVNSKKLLNCVDAFEKDSRIQITVKENKLELISRKNSGSKLPCSDLSMFPEIKLPSKTVECNFIIPQINLKSQIKKTLFSIADPSEVRTVLKGGLMEFDNDKLRLITADGKRLSVTESHADMLQIVGKYQECILPEKTLVKLEKLLENSKNSVDIYFEKSEDGFFKKIEFQFNNIIILSSVIDGKYPNWRQMMDTNYSNKIFLDTKDFKKVATRHAKFFKAIESEKKDGDLDLTKFEIKDKELVITSEDYTNESLIYDKIKFSEKYSEDVTLYLSVKFLDEMLKSVDDTEVLFQIEDQFAPVSFNGYNPEEFRHILMPIRIK